jgi:peroxiredoxin
MGQARRQRLAAEAARAQQRTRTIWMVTAGVAVVALLATSYLAVRANTGTAPPPASTQSAADRNAPADLVAAANAIGFHTSTEPGVGQLEGEPASAAQGPSTADLLKPGSTAPAFTLKTPQGETVSLSDYRGKAVLLEFFATWCPHCQAEAPHLAKLANQLKSDNVQFLSVNADSEDAASVFAFHRYFGLPYPALLDQGSPTGSFSQQGGSGPVTSAYHLHSYPTFYVINPDGTVAWASDGEQPDALLKQLLLKASGS